jgi:hypothetical protein
VGVAGQDRSIQAPKETIMSTPEDEKCARCLAIAQDSIDNGASISLEDEYDSYYFLYHLDQE